jgi:UDP-glucose 4-epimerase
MTNPGRTVLLTGGAGYIGAHIALALQDSGQPVVILDNFLTGSRRLLPAGVPMVEADCANRAAVEATVRTHDVDVVVHCAGLISVTESVREPLLYHRGNVAASINLFEAALSGGARHILFSSTATVYGAPDVATLDEDRPVAPVNPYAASKAMVERMLADLGSTGRMTAAVLRYFNVAGADPRGRAGQISSEATHLIKIAAEAAIGKRSHVDVTGNDFPTPDGTGVRDYIHVSDLAAAHIAAIARLRARAPSFTVNIGYGRGASVLDVLDCFDQVTGCRIERRMAPRRPGDVARLVANPARAMALLDWSPAHARLEDIVRDAIAWERQLAGSAPRQPG